MQSQREIALNTVFLLQRASRELLFINDLEKKRRGNSRRVLYTLNHLIKANLIRESIERDMYDIPRVALSPTEKGKALLKKIECMSVKHPNPAAAILAEIAS